MRLPSRERKIQHPRARQLVVEEQRVNRSAELRQALEFVEEGDRALLDEYMTENIGRVSYWYALGARRFLFGDTSLGQSFDQTTLANMGEVSERAANVVRRGLSEPELVSRNLVNIQRGLTQLMGGDPERLIALRSEIQPALTREWGKLVEVAWEKSDTYLGYLRMLLAGDPDQAKALIADPKALQLATGQLEEKRKRLSEAKIQGSLEAGILDQIAFTLYEMRVLFPETDLPVSADERVDLIKRLGHLRQASKQFPQDQFPRVLYELAVAFAPEIQVDQYGIHVPNKQVMGKVQELPDRPTL